MKVVDFGIRSYDLAYALMDDWDLVILVDALPGDGKPGNAIHHGAGAAANW